MVVGIDGDNGRVLLVSIHVAGVEAAVRADGELSIHDIAVDGTTGDNHRAPRAVVGHLEIHVSRSRAGFSFW